MVHESWASAMVVACAGRATSGTSRVKVLLPMLTGSWLHWVAYSRVLAVLELLVMLVLLLVLVVVCEWVLLLVPLHRLEVGGLLPHGPERRRQPCIPPKG